MLCVWLLKKTLTKSCPKQSNLNFWMANKTSGMSIKWNTHDDLPKDLLALIRGLDLFLKRRIKPCHFFLLTELWIGFSDLRGYFNYLQKIRKYCPEASLFRIHFQTFGKKHAKFGRHGFGIVSPDWESFPSLISTCGETAAADLRGRLLLLGLFLGATGYSFLCPPRKRSAQRLRPLSKIMLVSK